MAVKTERITILGSPEFKAFLGKEAAKEKVSVSELVRRRCEQPTRDDSDELIFAELVAELNTSVGSARKNLDKGIADAQALLDELRSRRNTRTIPKKVSAQ